MFADPLCKPHHHQRLARSLRMPDDARLFLFNARLGGIKCKYLIRAHHLLHSGIKYNGIMNKPEKTLRLKHLKNGTVHCILYIRRCEHTWRTRLPARLLPLEPVFRRSKSCPILDSFRLATGNKQLSRRKESRDFFIFLIAPILPNTLFYRHRRFLKLDYRKKNTVHIKAYIGTTMGNFATNRRYTHLFGD